MAHPSVPGNELAELKGWAATPMRVAHVTTNPVAEQTTPRQSGPMRAPHDNALAPG